ncbi:putative Kinesin motor domain [Paratrimastix pyriformis]|uniref:Kinesin-like protein n=1 Tax=Paratrimastix pyriformis TaxID=342808 RepID=A0ABQ8UN57_9EUKA|nr:putative Kinesin motor domain [Paratrimastix pyriformis]
MLSRPSVVNTGNKTPGPGVRPVSAFAPASISTGPLNPVHVYLRVRPVLPGEQPNPNVAVDSNSKTIHITTSAATKSYDFRRIFQDVKNDELFNTTVAPYIPAVFSGQSLLVMAYGITCSGKTYTTCGTPADPGLIALILRRLLSPPEPEDVLAQGGCPAVPVPSTPMGTSDPSGTSSSGEAGPLYPTDDPLASPPTAPPQTPRAPATPRAGPADFQLETPMLPRPKRVVPGVPFQVRLSYVEVRSDHAYDLLPPGKERPVLNFGRSVDLGAATAIPVTSYEQALALHEQALTNRAVSSTALNSNSSRSHCFCIASVYQADTLVGRVAVVDLAGSERAAVTQQEQNGINISLMTLGQCMRDLNEKPTNKLPGTIIRTGASLTAAHTQGKPQRPHGRMRRSTRTHSIHPVDHPAISQGPGERSGHRHSQSSCEWRPTVKRR